MHPNYRLEGLTMTLQGGTFTDTELSAGGPDGGSYFNRNTVAANTSSPMTMATTPTGTGAIAVVAGQDYTVSWWAQKSVVGGPQTRSEEHTSELQSLMRTSYAVFCLKKKKE